MNKKDKLRGDQNLENGKERDVARLLNSELKNWRVIESGFYLACFALNAVVFLLGIRKGNIPVVQIALLLLSSIFNLSATFMKCKLTQLHDAEVKVINDNSRHYPRPPPPRPEPQENYREKLGLGYLEFCR